VTKTPLASARQLLGWSQTKLAAEAGAPISTINDLEHGRNVNPSYALVTNVVAALRRGGLAGVTAESLFPVASTNTRASA
jgi:transcriptional regulator with XRE-family HTH domain